MKIYWAWHNQENGPVRIWLESWLPDQFEILNNRDFRTFQALIVTLSLETVIDLEFVD